MDQSEVFLVFVAKAPWDILSPMLLVRGCIAITCILFLFFWLSQFSLQKTRFSIHQADHHERRIPARGMYLDFKTRLETDMLRQEFLRKRHEAVEMKVFKRPAREFTKENPFVVLLWHGMQSWYLLDFAQDPECLRDAPVPTVITYNQIMVDKAHVVIFFDRMERKVARQLKGWQAAALLTIEPTLGSSNVRGALDGVDMLISYSRYAEVRVDYTYEMFLKNLTQPSVEAALHGILKRMPHWKEKRTDALGCFFISNCVNFDSPFRLNYLRKLMEFVPIHSRGYCMRTQGLKDHCGDKISCQSTYKFALAFENTILDDYVTEKFYQAIMSDAIPVYLGAPNIQEFLPNKTAKVIINAFDYPDPADLASYLIHLANNEQEYMEYFQWRSYPLEPTFNDQHSYFLKGARGFPLKAVKWYLNHSN